MRILHAIKGSLPVMAEQALQIGRALDQSPQNWLNLQTDYDLKTAELASGPHLRGIRSVVQAWNFRRGDFWL